MAQLRNADSLMTMPGESNGRSTTSLLIRNVSNDRRAYRQSRIRSRWRAIGILLWWPFFFTLQAGASGPDPNRPIKQMRHASWNEASGLSGVVYSLAQTTDGFLWIGTSTGLYRFDGLKFEPFLESTGDHPILEVRTLLSTSDGGLWIGYRTGVAYLKQDQVSLYTEQDGLPYGRVSNLAQTPDGAIWAAVTLSGGGKVEGGQNSLAGLARFSNGRWEKIGADWNYSADSAENVVVDGAGTLWVTGGDSIYFLPRGSRTFQHTKVKISPWTEVCTGPDGSLWIADSIAHTLFNFRKSPESDYFSETAEPLQDINEIRFDRSHSFWLATGRGLYRIPFDSIKTLPKQTNSEIERDQFMVADGMSGREVHAVLEDREGNIWIGTTNGLDRFSDRSVTQFNVGHTPSDLIAGPHSEVWASQFGLSPYLIPIHDCEPFLLTDWFTRSFHMDRKGTLWASMQSDPATWESRALWKDQNGKIEKVQSPPELKGPLIDGIVSDATGRLWMTIRGYGEYTLQNGKWEKIPVLSGNDSDISPDAQFVDGLGRAWLVYYARSIVVMIDGAKHAFFTADRGLNLGNPIVGWASGTQVWVSGTKGLGFFDGEGFQNIRASDGTVFKNVTAVIPTEQDGLWLKAPEGVIQIPPDELANFFRDHAYAVRYRIFDGATDFVAQLARYKPASSGTDAVRSSDGKLWFSVSTGVAMIDPAHLARNDFPPPVFIRSLTADGRLYSTYRDLTLPKSTHEVSLDYTALSLTLPERNRFRYQLVGVDKEWRDVGTRRQAFYTNLAPGTYTFNVMAANNDGVWNETEASIIFKIPPTFLQSIWFTVSLIVTAVFTIWLLYVLRLRQATGEITDRLGVRLQERERIARELHDTLLQDFQAMILRFHVISRRLVSGDPNRLAMDEGLRFADKVLAEGRNRIRDIRGDTKLPEDLSKAFADYGNQISQSRPLSFDVKITGAQTEIDPIIRDEIFRIGREAIGNAFKHSECSKIQVELAYAPREFQMIIRDDGNGIDPSILSAGGKPGHWGIYNMLERAQKIGATLEFSSQPNAGTTLELKLRLRSFKRSLTAWLT
jgi:signal transduction histidine kinase/ligand-binding sensor domain-containing protein